MRQAATTSAREFYAQTYDACVADWPGEMEFYQELATAATARGGAVLELACGTGRVAVRLAQADAQVTGLDRCPAMLAVARGKRSRVRWVQADMRAFELGARFGLILIPGHAFQNLLTADDQLACLAAAWRHLSPDGVLVAHLDHQDVGWLGDLRRDQGGVFASQAPFAHPHTGRPIRAWHAWSYQPATQTAVLETVWEELGPEGEVTARWETGPVRLHCVFRLEMEHLLARAGFAVRALYGDFFRRPLGDDSSDMIWVAARA